MTIRVTDPLFLLSAQTGMSVAELSAKAAAGNPDVEKPQQALKTGEPIPIIFCRRTTANKGGVLVQPKMTEGNFSNPIIEETYTSNNFTSTFVEAMQVLRVKYRLVLSDGELEQLQVRDMFYGNARRGTWNQKYNGSAGSWDPGNTINQHFDYVVQPSPSGTYNITQIHSLNAGETLKTKGFIHYKRSDGLLILFRHLENTFPSFCGTSGTYSGLTTLSFEYELEDSKAAKFDKTVSAFVRNGIKVTRLIDGVVGASDNYVDLVKYLFTTGNRLATDLIDNTALTAAANFVNANGFFFNGQLIKSENLLDWLQRTSVNFLLRLSNSGGKFGLLPRLPYNTDHTIKTTQITPEFTFTEQHVVPGGFEVEYISLEDREPVCFVVQWRQQPESDFGLVRTVQVRYESEAASGPFVDIDMSDYCTSENHAVKVGTYRLAQRKFVTHHLRLTVRDSSYNSTLVIGDLVRVRLLRETAEGDVEFHDKVYEINRIDKNFSSTIVYDLTHFPIDSQGRSIVALAVNAAVGAGNIINVGRSTFDGDENSSTDTSSIGSDSGGGDNTPELLDTEYEIPTPDVDDTPYPEGPDNPADPLDDTRDDTSALTITGSNTGYSGSSATPGNTLEVSASDLPCGDGRVCFYRLDKETGAKTLRNCVTSAVGGKFSSAITTDDISYVIIAEGSCPDPSSPDGYGPPIDLGEKGPVEIQPTDYSFARFSGELVTYELESGSFVQTTQSVTTEWIQYDGTSASPYLTISSAYTAVGGAIYTWGPMDPYFENPYEQSGMFAEWTPWVNYYDPVQSQWIGTNQTWSVPWRSHLEAKANKFFSSGGNGIYMGGIGGKGYNGVSAVTSPVPSFGTAPATSVFLPPASEADAPLRTVSIKGSWEFSNDTTTEKTVAAAWKGNGNDGNPYTG